MNTKVFSGQSNSVDVRVSSSDLVKQLKEYRCQLIKTTKEVTEAIEAIEKLEELS